MAYLYVQGFACVFMCSHECWEFLKSMVRSNILSDKQQANKQPRTIWIAQGRRMNLARAMAEFGLDTTTMTGKVGGKCVRFTVEVVPVTNPVSRQDKRKLSGMCNSDVHSIARQLVKHMSERGMLQDSNVFDDNGGFLPNGFVSRRHGGLFKPSFDRIVNSRNGKYMLHYPDIRLARCNIRVVAAGTNVRFRASILEHQIRARQYVSPEEVAEQLELSSYSVSALHQHVYKYWMSDVKCLNSFDSAHSYYQYLVQLLVEQRGLCAVSRLLMLSNKSGPWKMSPDAIDPRLGHVRGNLRLVCVCLNSVNMSKTESTKSTVETSWTRRLYRQYYQIRSVCV